MKVTEKQISILFSLLEGSDERDNQLSSHIESINEVIEYFVQEIGAGCIDRFPRLAHCISLLAPIKNDLESFF